MKKKSRLKSVRFAAEIRYSIRAPLKATNHYQTIVRRRLPTGILPKGAYTM